MTFLGEDIAWALRVPEIDSAASGFQLMQYKQSSVSDPRRSPFHPLTAEVVGTWMDYATGIREEE